LRRDCVYNRAPPLRPFEDQGVLSTLRQPSAKTVERAANSGVVAAAFEQNELDLLDFVGSENAEAGRYDCRIGEAEQGPCLTGIDDAMVAGQVIDPDAVAAFASSASLVVAHNAGFDRKFVERFSDVFTTKPWGCSMAEVPWQAEGAETVKLAYLAMERGFFYDRHRALNDCYAAIELLSQPLPRTGEVAFSKLLDSARGPLWRIWAENSPFDLKDRLKERGYRWNGDPGPSPRAWFIDVSDDQRDAEIGFLQAEIYGREIELLTRRITAYDRYSDRC